MPVEGDVAQPCPACPAGPGSCSSPHWCSCRSSVSTTSSSWPRRTPRSQGRSGKSRCTTRCSSTPSRCAAGWAGGRAPSPLQVRLWALTPLSPQGFFVAIIYCFCNGEVSGGQHWGKAGRTQRRQGVPPALFLHLLPVLPLFLQEHSEGREKSFQMIQAQDVLGLVGPSISGGAQCVPNPMVAFSVTQIGRLSHSGPSEPCRFWVCQLHAARHHGLRMTEFLLVLEFSKHTPCLCLHPVLSVVGAGWGHCWGWDDRWQRDRGTPDGPPCSCHPGAG